MCKKVIALLTLMTTLLALSACNSTKLHDSDMDIYEKIHAYYNGLERYSADVAFTCYSNKTENHYSATQKALGNDKFYIKVETPEQNGSVTTITNGETTKTIADSSDYSVTVPTAEVMNLLFVNHFFKSYYASEDTCLAVNSSETGGVTILETAVLPAKDGAAKMALSVDNKTLAPVSLTVYSHGGSVTTSCKFSNFKYNDKSVQDTDFTTD